MAKNINSFLPFDDDNSAKYLANHYPSGKFFANKNNTDSLFYKFIKCCANFISIVTGQMYKISNNIDVDNIDEMITEWETSVNVPKDHWRLDTLAKRKTCIKRLISKTPVYNIQEEYYPNIETTVEQYILEMTGYRIIIKRGVDYYSDPTMTFTLFISVDAGIHNTETNQFPMIFPIQFGDVSLLTDQLKLIIEKELRNILPAPFAFVIGIL